MQSVGIALSANENLPRDVACAAATAVRQRSQHNAWSNTLAAGLQTLDRGALTLFDPLLLVCQLRGRCHHGHMSTNLSTHCWIAASGVIACRRSELRFAWHTEASLSEKRLLQVAKGDNQLKRSEMVWTHLAE